MNDYHKQVTNIDARNDSYHAICSLEHACEMSVKIIQSLTKQIEYFNLELFKVNMV